MWTYVWVSDSTPFIHLSVFISVPVSLYYCISKAELEVKDGETSGSSFIVQDCFSSPGFSVFLMKMNTVLSRSPRTVLKF